MAFAHILQKLYDTFKPTSADPLDYLANWEGITNILFMACTGGGTTWTKAASGAARSILYHNTYSAPADVTVESYVSIKNGVYTGDVGLVARSASASRNYYFACLRETPGPTYTIELYSCVNNSLTALGSYNLGTYALNLRLECSGSQITVYKNATSVISVSNTSVTAAGKCGVRADIPSTATLGYARYHDFRIYETTSGSYTHRTQVATDAFGTNYNPLSDCANWSAMQDGGYLKAAGGYVTNNDPGSLTNPEPIYHYSRDAEANVSVQADITPYYFYDPGVGLDKWIHFSLIARGSEPVPYSKTSYVVDFDDVYTISGYRRQIKLSAFVNDVETVLGIAASEASSSTVRLECDGSTIRVFQDASLIMDVSNSQVTSAGKTGIHAFIMHDSGADCGGKLDNYAIFTNQLLGPTNLTATQGTKTEEVTLSWTASATPDVTYKAERSVSGAGSYSVVASSIYALTYDDETAGDSVQYDYRVRAVRSEEESDPSNVATGWVKVIGICLGDSKIIKSRTSDKRAIAVLPAGTNEITAKETSASPVNWNWEWTLSPSCGVISGGLDPTTTTGATSSTTRAIVPGSNDPDTLPSCSVSSYFYYDYDNGHRHVGVLYGDQATANTISGATCGAGGAQIGTPGGNVAVRLNGEMKLSVCSLPVADKQISFATGVGISADGRKSGNVAKGINAKAVRQLFRYSTTTSKTTHDAARDEVHILTEGEKSIAFWKEPASSTWQTGPDGLTELETLYSGDTITGFREKVKPALGYAAWQYNASGHLVSTTTANDNVTYYENDVNGKVTKITTNADDNVIYGRTSGDVTYIQFDPAGTPERRTQYFTYDVNGRVSSHKSYAGCTTSYDWNEDGKLASETDGEGYVTYFAYDAAEAAARPSKIVYPDGSYMYFEYEPSLTASVDASGNATYYRYNSFSNPTAVMDALGNTAYFEYNDSGLKTSEKTPRGYSTTYENDTYGNVTSVTNPLSNTTYFEYARTDYGSRLTKQIDALGHETYYGYDAKGNRTSATDALGASSYLAYDATGMMTTQKDALENATYFTYNTRGLTTAVKNALGNATYFEYNPFGDRTAVKDARGNSTYYEVDAMGRVTRTTDAIGNFTQTGYDGRGLVTAQVDQLNHASYMEYDGASRLKKSINAIGNETYYRYDLRGNRTSVTDARGNTTYMAYDVVNRLYCTVDANINKTYFTYDADGNRTSTKDARLNITRQYYDALGRNKGTIDALSNESYYEFDAVGNTTAAVNQLGKATYYYFDALNRQKGQVDALGHETYLEFDAVGNQVAAIDQLGYASYFYYDALNRRKGTIDALGNESYFVFDAVGNSTASVNPLGHASYFYYDALNRQKGNIDQLGYESYFVFDSVGNSTASVNQLGRATYYYYDALNRRKGQVDALGNETYLVFDAAGNRTASVDARTNATYFYYDALNRQKGTVDTLGNESYIVYDAAGNTIATVNARSFSTYFYYDALNRQKGNIDALGNETYFVFDAVGNTAATVDQLGNASYFVYDVLNRQTCLIDALENKTYYEYDAAGNRMAVTDALENSTYFYYDAVGRSTCIKDALRHDSYFEYDQNGNRTATVDPLGYASYWYYDARNMLKGTVDALGHENYFVYDAVGNRTAEVDPLNRAAYYEFDALGRLSATKNPLNQAAYYEYDENGNTVAHKGIDGVATYYTFDELNRQTAIAPTNDAASYFAYDAASNRSWTKAGPYESYFTYDVLNRLSIEKGPSISVYHEYDAAGREIFKKNLAKYGNPGEFYYSFDEANRMVTAILPDPDTVGNVGSEYLTYDAGSNITKKIIWGKNAQHEKSLIYTAYIEYDELNRKKVIHNILGNGTTDSRYENTWDASGRLEKTLRENDNAVYYTYDALSRPISETWKDSLGVTAYAFAWDYNEVGKRTYEYKKMNAVETKSYYDYDTLDRVTQVHEALADEHTYFTYDGRGNIILVDEPGYPMYFSYDDFDRVTQTTYKNSGGAFITEYFSYDGSGRLFGRRAKNQWGFESPSYYAYDASGKIVGVQSYDTLQVSYLQAKSVPVYADPRGNYPIEGNCGLGSYYDQYGGKYDLAANSMGESISGNVVDVVMGGMIQPKYEASPHMCFTPAGKVVLANWGVYPEGTVLCGDAANQEVAQQVPPGECVCRINPEKCSFDYSSDDREWKPKALSGNIKTNRDGSISYTQEYDARDYYASLYSKEGDTQNCHIIQKATITKKYKDNSDLKTNKATDYDYKTQVMDQDFKINDTAASLDRSFISFINRSDNSVTDIFIEDYTADKTKYVRKWNKTVAQIVDGPGFFKRLVPNPVVEYHFHADNFVLEAPMVKGFYDITVNWDWSAIKKPCWKIKYSSERVRRDEEGKTVRFLGEYDYNGEGTDITRTIEGGYPVGK